MKKWIASLEKGQSLVFFAIVFFFLMAMLAFAIDGGSTYFHRRTAQNAADAGALAAAEVYCSTINWTSAQAAGYNYAVNQNGADTATVSLVADRVVKVDTSITFNTFFGSVLGQPAITTPASAQAGCYPPTSGLGVLPVAWSCHPPIGGELGDMWSDTCDYHYWEPDKGEVCTPESGNMYVIMDSADVEDDSICQDPPNSGLPAGALDCDLDNDGDDDIEAVSGGNRAWLDLDGSGGGASDLSAWVKDGFPDDVDIHYWFPGQTGVTTSVYDTVFDYQLNNNVLVPVFDMFCPDGPPNPADPGAGACPALPHPEDTVIVGTGSDYFHIIAFAMFNITCVDAGSHGPCPGHQALGLDPNVKTLEGCFVRDNAPGGGGGPNNNPWIGTWEVYLIE